MSLPGWNTRWQIEADEKVFYDTLGALGKELDALREKVAALEKVAKRFLVAKDSLQGYFAPEITDCFLCGAGFYHPDHPVCQATSRCCGQEYVICTDCGEKYGGHDA